MYKEELLTGEAIVELYEESLKNPDQSEFIASSIKKLETFVNTLKDDSDSSEESAEDDDGSNSASSRSQED